MCTPPDSKRMCRKVKHFSGHLCPRAPCTLPFYDRRFGSNQVLDHTDVPGGAGRESGPLSQTQPSAKKITFQPAGSTFVAPACSPPLLPPSPLSQNVLFAARKRQRCEVGVVMALVLSEATRGLVGFITPVGGRSWQGQGEGWEEGICKK